MPNAGMVKLVDTPDLGSGAARCVGSSPITRTKPQIERFEVFFMTFLKNLKLIFTLLPFISVG